MDPVISDHSISRRKEWFWMIIIFLLVAGLTVVTWILFNNHTAKKTGANLPAVKTVKNESAFPGLQLDTSKNYGNKYSDGVLPVGDGKYSATEAKAGSVYVCQQYARNLVQDSGGAGSRGPWFSADHTTYNINKKARVSGNVMWQAQYSMNISGATRTIVSNGLPSHPTGVYPIAVTDAAYTYDRNPNSIKSQSLTYALPASPAYGAPQCMGGEAGIMTTGVPIFNGFDAGGRDAGAWEVQDSCSGHPQISGEYHYHTLSSCIKDVSVHSVIGYALDGYPITGPQVSTNNILTTADLDECHGLTSRIKVGGKDITSYHYVMTQDFPYSVSCFRSVPIQQAASQQQSQQRPHGPPPRQ